MASPSRTGTLVIQVKNMSKELARKLYERVLWEEYHGTSSTLSTLLTGGTANWHFVIAAAFGTPLKMEPISKQKVLATGWSDKDQLAFEEWITKGA